VLLCVFSVLLFLAKAYYANEALSSLLVCCSCIQKNPC
jgi:hypothetical protein